MASAAPAADAAAPPAGAHHQPTMAAVGRASSMAPPEKVKTMQERRLEESEKENEKTFEARLKRLEQDADETADFSGLCLDATCAEKIASARALPPRYVAAADAAARSARSRFELLLPSALNPCLHSAPGPRRCLRRGAGGRAQVEGRQPAAALPEPAGRVTAPTLAPLRRRAPRASARRHSPICTARAHSDNNLGDEGLIQLAKELGQNAALQTLNLKCARRRRRLARGR